MALLHPLSKPVHFPQEFLLPCWGNTWKGNSEGSPVRSHRHFLLVDRNQCALVKEFKVDFGQLRNVQSCFSVLTFHYGSVSAWGFQQP